MDFNQNNRVVIGGGTSLCSLEVQTYSITMYWVIMCCGWVGGRALDCPLRQGGADIICSALAISGVWGWCPQC